jgi:hypothetical protein
MKIDSIVKDIERHDLGETVPAALHLIRGRGLDDLEMWLKLELNGYWNSNPALQDGDEVPRYRQIVGQHYNDLGHPLIISQSDLQYVNTTRARWGVIDLEQMFKKGGSYSIQDPHMIELIRELGVEVTRFSFDAQQLTSVLSTIRTDLAERLDSIDERTEIDDPTSDDEHIIELKPNIYGIGIDLRALGRKWKRVISRTKD